MKVTEEVCCGPISMLIAIVHDAEAMGQVLDTIDVGDADRDLVALFDGEVRIVRKHRRHRGHVDAHLIAITDHLGVRFKRHAIGLSLFYRIGEEGIISLPHMQRVDLRPVHDCRVMGLGKARAVVNEHHLIAGDIDELIVLGLERADVEEAILRRTCSKR